LPAVLEEHWRWHKLLAPSVRWTIAVVSLNGQSSVVTAKFVTFCRTRGTNFAV